MNSLFASTPHCHNALLFQRTAGEPCYFPLHHHKNRTELLLITEGKADYQIGNKPYTAEAGSMIVFHPEIWHEERSRTDKPFEFYFVAFEGLQLGALPPEHLVPPEAAPVFSMRPRMLRLKQLFAEIVQEKRNTLPESQWMADHLLCVLLAEVCRAYHYPQSQIQDAAGRITAKEALEQAQLFITNHYHRPLTLQEIADSVYLSSYYVCHLFQEAFGTSPIQYVIHLRMLAARQYLSTTSYSVEKIAGLVGYTSVTSFQATFKKSAGTTPGQYRKAHGEKNGQPPAPGR